MTAAEIAQALGGRRSGSAYMAPCPAHRDDNPSLAIRERDGRVLVHCHAGCDQRAVVEALKALGLWDADGSRNASWREWRDGIRYPAQWGTATAEYRYTDEIGRYLYSVVRFEPLIKRKPEDKEFHPGFYTDGGRWRWKKHPRQVLYRLPEVLEAPIVFIVEGEKDAETLRSWGFTVTTNAQGAKAPWLPEYTQVLRGREVIIIPDMDPPGIERGKTIARALLGAAARIILFVPEDLSGCKDISDWFGAGHSECELISMLEGVHAV